MLKKPSKNFQIQIQMQMTYKISQSFLIHKYVCGKIFTKIKSVVFMRSCQQSDRRTDKCRVKHNLLSRGNYASQTLLTKYTNSM